MQSAFSGVSMENNYGAARQALVDARTSVFSLDVTDADYHSLEAGLQIVSEQTGGFYAKTHLFPDIAMRQLAGALAGYYALFVEKADSPGAVHDIKTELTHRKGRVLALTSVFTNVIAADATALTTIPASKIDVPPLPPAKRASV